MNLLYKTSIDCGHRIEDSDDLITKKCAEPHGHTYNLEFTISLDALKIRFGRTFVDFALLKNPIETALSNYDHHDITEKYGLHTVEELAVRIKYDVAEELDILPAVMKLRVFETAKYGVEC